MGGIFGPKRVLGLKTVEAARRITYYISMKKLFILMISLAAFPACAFNHAALERAVLAAPVDNPVLCIYAASPAIISQRAIRLGYNNFHTRINTPRATETDTEIAILITTQFQPFFDKLNNLENKPEKERPALIAQYNQEFEQLVIQLAQLFFKNQRRYSPLVILNDQAALQETINIIQEAITKGSF